MEDNALFKLNNFINIYINEKKSLNLSKNTINTYFNVLNDFSEYYRGYCEDISLESLDKAFIVSFLNEKRLSASSKNLYTTVLKNFFAYLEKNAFLMMDTKKCFLELSHKVMKKEPVALNALEYEKVITWFEKEAKKRKRSFYSYRNVFMLKLLLLTGIRASELLALRLNDFTRMYSKENRAMYKIKILGKGNKERYVYMA